MEQLEGFITKGQKDKMCILRESLYGLKQSPRQWYKRFDSFMVNVGFVRCEYDNCIYCKEVEDDIVIYLLLYVDDTLVACNNFKEIKRVKELLKKEFEMKDIRAASNILAMEIAIDKIVGTLFITQQDYVKRMLKRFNMEECKEVLTPLAQHFKLSGRDSPSTDEEAIETEIFLYAIAIGSLMHVMICTRLD